jgi:hypothetical protein
VAFPWNLEFEIWVFFTDPTSLNSIGVRGYGSIGVKPETDGNGLK